MARSDDSREGRSSGPPKSRASKPSGSSKHSKDARYRPPPPEVEAELAERGWGGLARRGAWRATHDDVAPVPDNRRDPVDPVEVAEAAARAERREARERRQAELRDQAAAAVGRGAASSPDRKSTAGPRALERAPLPARPRGVETAAKAAQRRLPAAKANRLLGRLRKAAAAYELERYDDAREQLRPVLKSLGDVAEVRELNGLLLYRTGKWRSAADELEAFRQQVGTTEQDPVLADCYRALGHWDDVDALWRELRAASPSAELVTEGRIVAAGALADRGDVHGAIRLLSSGWKMPRKPREHHLRRAYALADLYERAGEIPRARELFGRLREASPDLADVTRRHRALS